jgi:hypothetical protein
MTIGLNVSAAYITDGTAFYLAGDANNDGVLDLCDLVRAKKIAAKSDDSTISAIDLDGDGKTTASDIVLLRSILLSVDNSQWSEPF